MDSTEATKIETNPIPSENILVDDSNYSIQSEFDTVSSSKLPEILLLGSILTSIIIIALVLYCVVCKKQKKVPEAEEVDVTEKFDIENV